MKRLWVLLLLFLCGFSGIAVSETNWKLFSTGSDNIGISTIAIEGESVWAGVSGTGAVKMNRNDGTYITYTTNDGLLRSYVSKIVIDNNGVKWFGYESSYGKINISSFDNSEWKQYITETVPAMAAFDSLYYSWRATIDDIVIDKDNKIFFSTSGTWWPDSLSQYRMGINTLIINDNNTWECKMLSDDSIAPIHLTVDIASPDTLWYVSLGNAGYFVKPNYKRIMLDTFPDFFNSSSIAIDKDNFIWYGVGDGAILYNKKSAIQFDSETTGIKGLVRAIAVDKNNVKWFGSQVGITRYDGASWVTYAPDGWHYDRNDGLTDRVNSLAFDDDGFLWVGTNKGLYRFEESPVSVHDAAPKPISVSIEGVSPNPFNASSTITFSLPNPDMATLTVYSLTGQKVRTLVSERLSAGKHSATWDGRDERGGAVSSGVFIATLQSGGKTDSRKLLMLK